MALLIRHDLDTCRQQDSPVEVALESLLSTSTLMVSAAPDMDLVSFIDYFLGTLILTLKLVPTRILTQNPNRLGALTTFWPTGQLTRESTSRSAKCCEQMPTTFFRSGTSALCDGSWKGASIGPRTQTAIPLAIQQSMRPQQSCCTYNIVAFTPGSTTHCDNINPRS